MPTATVVISQLVLAIALPYFVLTLVLGIRVARRDGGLRGQERRVVDIDVSGAPEFDLYVLVPALNEQLVIGATVRQLLADPAVMVIVIDDGSDDDTAAHALEEARAAGAPDSCQVVRRTLPDARQGKGAALNAGFEVVCESVRGRGLDPERVVVAVMDADGRLSQGGLRAALPLFRDPRVGGVQLTVRIRNRSKLIGQFQDVEFWMISALSQFARTLSGTVSLGGNGQFTRLSALMELSGQPWTDSLTEDLDLGLRLVEAGWRITTTSEVYVDQQGVESYRRLLRQRTRWYQGHMQCGRRLPELWRSRRVSQLALAEVTSYLLVPWVIVLPWSILQQWIFVYLIIGSGHGLFAADLPSPALHAAYILLWYLLSFLPNICIGIIYARRTRAVSVPRALVLGHLMIIWNYIGYVSSWRACWRMLRGQSGWDKTARSLEEPAPPSYEGVSPRRPLAATPIG